MKDPVEARADNSRDLYDIASWEPRTALDRLAITVHRGILEAGRVLVVLLGIVILSLILAGGVGAIVIDNPYILGLVVFSIIPAALLALYIYLTDITTNEPPTLLAITFLLSILFAGFAAVLNASFAFLQAFSLLGIVLFYYLIVGPSEETVKLLAIRLSAFRDERFDSVIDGAVYGAVAGLGFATIENLVYITQSVQTPTMLVTASVTGWVAQFLATVDAGGQITAVRGLAGPGHVIYSAFAGYYLGLAKFNRQYAGPIVAKGLLIAAFIHATYNTLVGIVPLVVSLFVPGVPLIVLFFGFIVVYDGIFIYVLYRKLSRYRHVYRTVQADATPPAEQRSELTEFDA